MTKSITSSLVSVQYVSLAESWQNTKSTKGIDTSAGSQLFCKSVHEPSIGYPSRARHDSAVNVHVYEASVFPLLGCTQHVLFSVRGQNELDGKHPLGPSSIARLHAVPGGGGGAVRQPGQ